jgi:glc operon protein GlcG
MIEGKNIGLAEARKIIDAMLEYTNVTPSKEPTMGPMSFAVVDSAAVLVCFVRMDGAPPLTREMAENKAYTAIKWKRDTRGIKQLLEDPTLTIKLNIQSFSACGPQTHIPGGNLLRTNDGSIVGAVGSSGRDPEEDEEVTLAGVRAFEKILQE